MHVNPEGQLCESLRVVHVYRRAFLTLRYLMNTGPDSSLDRRHFKMFRMYSQVTVFASNTDYSTKTCEKLAVVDQLIPFSCKCYCLLTKNTNRTFSTSQPMCSSDRQQQKSTINSHVSSFKDHRIVFQISIH